MATVLGIYRCPERRLTFQGLFPVTNSHRFGTCLARQSFGVYSAPSQTFASNLLDYPFKQPDGVHYACVYRRTLENY
jgi:hypothetical protein